MKKVFSVLVAIAMLACLCVPAFAADASTGLGDITGSLDDLSSSLGGLDLSGFDISGIKDAAGNLEADLAETDILGTITGLLGGITGGSESGSGESSGDILSGFDPSGLLTSFTEGLDLSSLSTLFEGLTSALGGEGIDLSGFSFGDFDISSILSGNQGTGAGVAGIMDTFGGVLESLGLDSAIIESLLDNDIVNFFANLYLGGVEEPTETTTTTEPPVSTSKPPETGDTSTAMVAIATLSVASAAAFVCTRKKHA